MAELFDRKRLGPLKGTVAIVGVGETDYADDYRGADGKAARKGEARYDSYTLASRALKRALDDAGLNKDDIDGLCTGPTLSSERAVGHESALERQRRCRTVHYRSDHGHQLRAV